MSTLVGIISDTHGLLRESVLKELAGAALIVHAGDIGGPEVLETLRKIAPVFAVRGNVDRAPWAHALPLVEAVEVEQARLYVLHDLAALELEPAAAGFHAVISGHSHQPRIETIKGVLYLNPGSAGPRRFSLPVSMARLHVSGAKLRADLVRLK